MDKTKLQKKLPGCRIKVKTHVYFTMKRLQLIFGILQDVVNQRGLGWNEERKTVKVEHDEVWKDYVNISAY